MDSRAVFFLTFMFTFFGTLLVASVCYFTGQGVIETVIFSVSSMWILGVSSLILIQNIYQNIVLPLEEDKIEELEAAKKKERNLKEIEKIQEDPTIEKASKESAKKDAPSEKESPREKVDV